MFATALVLLLLGILLLFLAGLGVPAMLVEMAGFLGVLALLAAGVVFVLGARRDRA